MCYMPCHNEQFVRQHMKNKTISLIDGGPTTEQLDTHLTKSLFSGDSEGTPGIV